MASVFYATDANYSPVVNEGSLSGCHFLLPNVGTQCPPSLVSFHFCDWMSASLLASPFMIWSWFCTRTKTYISISLLNCPFKIFKWQHVASKLWLVLELDIRSYSSYYLYIKDTKYFYSKTEVWVIWKSGKCKVNTMIISSKIIASYCLQNNNLSQTQHNKL
jgi:hypothetical protein